MKLCIAEKPSVAQDIAKVIGANGGSRSSGYLEGNGYCVTWVFGHLCELKEPHDYNSIWKKWNVYDLPILPDKFGIKLKEDSGVKKQFDVIKRLVARADEVINCGDAGQEGELIQRWVLMKAGNTKPVWRLWISSLTEDAIREGFANLRPSTDFDRLYSAGNARAIGDWLLGMNATRAFTLTYGSGRQVLSIGRVQTPTLALIVQRHAEIQNFVPEQYWELKTLYKGATFSAQSGKFSKKDEAEAALQTIIGTDLVIADVQKKEGTEAPPQLFDLTSLQVECNKRFSFSADETLKIVQSLYEKKLSTYPRVDTRYLTDDIYAKVPQILKGLVPYMHLVTPLLGQKIKKSKRVFDNAKVTDHHAIIPTGVTPPTSLGREEKLVYDQIARRFIANFHPDSKISTTTINARAASVDFKCTGKQILSPGWRQVLEAEKKQTEDADNENVTLPEFSVGESGPHEPSLQEKYTTPPKMYTEGTLLKAMETAGKQVEDEELRLLMKENGIGRPSTRAAIIETLCRRHYIAREKKNLVPTLTGIQLIGLIKDELLKSVELTGQWERKLRKIERGEFQATDLIAEFREMVSGVVRTVTSDNSRVRIQEIVAQAGTKSTSTKTKKAAKTDVSNAEMHCPRCGKTILRGKTAWGCSGFREGCTVVVPFELYGKKLTDSQALQLFTKGKTSSVKGLTIDGKKTEGRLTFDSNFSVICLPSETENSAPTLHCPLCGGEILKGRTAWGCAGYVNGCSFKVPFVYMSKALTNTHLSVLLKKKQTGVINGFIGENGERQSGRLVLDPSGALRLQQ